MSKFLILDKIVLSHGFIFLFENYKYNDINKYQVKENQAEQLGQLAVQSITNAGKELNIRCPLTGEYKIGNNWSETH